MGSKREAVEAAIFYVEDVAESIENITIKDVTKADIEAYRQEWHSSLLVAVSLLKEVTEG